MRTSSSDMKRPRKSLINSTYLRNFAVKRAQKIAPTMRSAAIGFGLSLPLDDLRIIHFIKKTIRVANASGKLDWFHTSTRNQDLFIMTMITEFQRLGLAEPTN